MALTWLQTSLYFTKYCGYMYPSVECIEVPGVWP